MDNRYGADGVQLTGSNVQVEDLENVEVSAGSQVDTGLMQFKGNSIAVGILLDSSTNFEVTVQARNSLNEGRTDQRPIIDNTTDAALIDSGRIDLHGAYNSIRVRNTGASSFTIQSIIITTFM